MKDECHIWYALKQLHAHDNCLWEVNAGVAVALCYDLHAGAKLAAPEKPDTG